MAKWKIKFRGFGYVEADTMEEAREMFENGETVYEETEQDEPVEVDEFEVECEKEFNK